MQSLRSALLKQPLLAATVLLAALLVRMLVPAGFMPVVEDGRLTLAICSGYGPVAAAPAAHGMDHGGGHAMAGMTHHEDPQHQAQNPCAFADLAVPALGGADPIQLAAALLFIVAAALLPRRQVAPRAASHLRPPLRGPPLTA